MGNLSIEDAANAVRPSDQSNEGLKQRLVEQEGEAEEAGRTSDRVETTEKPAGGDPLDTNDNGVMDVLEDEDDE